jgi:hypothetical protein
LKDEFFHDLLNDTVHLCHLFSCAAFLALPLALLSNNLGVAFVAIDTITLWTLFRLVNYKLADSADEMFNCLSYFCGHKAT